MTHSKFLLYFLTLSNISLTLVVCPLQFEISYFNKRPSEEARIRAFTEYSLRDCLEECARRSYCEAAGYHRLVQFCELFSESEETTTQLDYVTIKRADMKLPDNENSLECEKDQPNNPCKECEPPCPFTNGKYLGNMNQVGSKRVIVCEKGYTIKRNRRIIECKTNGQWNSTQVCRKMNQCELNNKPCGSNQACCKTTCRTFSRDFNNAVCANVTDGWINVRCTQISIRNNELSNNGKAKETCRGLTSRLLKVKSYWNIKQISKILLKCEGDFGSAYWVHGWRNQTVTRIPRDLDRRLWKGNDSTVYNEGDCIGLTNSTEGYRLDGLDCNEEHPSICEKDIY